MRDEFSDFVFFLYLFLVLEQDLEMVTLFVCYVTLSCFFSFAACNVPTDQSEDHSKDQRKLKLTRRTQYKR